MSEPLDTESNSALSFCPTLLLPASLAWIVLLKWQHDESRCKVMSNLDWHQHGTHATMSRLTGYTHHLDHSSELGHVLFGFANGPNEHVGTDAR